MTKMAFNEPSNIEDWWFRDLSGMEDFLQNDPSPAASGFHVQGNHAQQTPGLHATERRQSPKQPSTRPGSGRQPNARQNQGAAPAANELQQTG
jgi:hypothetical protein